MNIRYANDSDYEFLKENDKHIFQSLTFKKIKDKEIIILENDDDQTVGWLRYGYFWDQIPFMNMLFIKKEHRSRGWGRDLVFFWEEEMKKRKAGMVMTSTQTDENAQHFYRKIGYQDAGCLILETQAMEMILTKKI